MRMKRTLHLLVTVGIMLLGAVPTVYGQAGAGAFRPSAGPEQAREQVTWSAVVEPASVAPGEKASLVLRAEIAEGWKMYAMDSPPPTRGVAPRLEGKGAGLVPSPSGFIQSAPEEGYDPAFDLNVRYFEKEAVFRTEVAVSEGAAPGRRAIGGVVEFMVCTAEKCLPPAQESFSTGLRVRAVPE